MKGYWLITYKLNGETKAFLHSRKAKQAEALYQLLCFVKDKTLRIISFQALTKKSFNILNNFYEYHEEKNNDIR